MKETQIRGFGSRRSRSAALLLLPIFALTPSAVLAQGTDDDQSLFEDLIDWIRDILDHDNPDDNVPPEGEDW